jgi:hypothetical protein
MFSLPTTLKVSAALSLGLVAGCGALDPFSTSIAIPATAAADGYVTDFPDAENSGADAIAVGDTFFFASTIRGFVRFPLASIPAGATILSAKLRLYQSAVFGNPYGVLGDMLVDHVNIGAALDVTDLNAVALQSDIGTISTSPAIGFIDLDVKDQIEADLAAARTNSDFRLRHVLTTNGDFVADYVRINDAENHLGDGNVPYLIIEFL